MLGLTALTYYYQLSFAGQPAGSQKLRVEPLRKGARLLLEAQVEQPTPKTRQRWESIVTDEGHSRRYIERVEGREVRQMEMEFLAREGVVTVSQGKEDFALPYLTALYDPLALLLAVCRSEMAIGQAQRFEMVGGRAYVERLANQALVHQGQESEVRVFRLRPGMSLVFLSGEGVPLKLSQKVGDRVFEATLAKVEQDNPKNPPPKPERSDGGPNASLRRRRRRRPSSV